MNSPLATKSVLWLMLGMVAAASMTFYVADIWSANQPPGFSDLYAPWWAAHELLLHGRSPYSPAVAHEIQTVIYGAPSVPSADDPDGLGGGFAYPPYAVLLLWPTVYLPFAAVQKIFLVAALLGLLLCLALSLRAMSLRLAPMQWLTIAIFFVGSFPALQAIKLQNLSVLAALLVAATLFLVSRDQLVLGGIFLAASSFKPQFVVALIPWLLLWSLADWRRRRSLALSFLATMLALVLVSRWLVPGWVSSFLHIVRAYRHYTYGHSLFDVWFTPSYGVVVSAIFLLGMLALCWRNRFEAAGSRGFLLATSLILAASVVVIPTLAPHAQLLLLPGFLWLLPGFSPWPASSSARTRLAKRLGAAAWMLLAWPWIMASGLLLTAIQVPVARLIRFWQVPLYTSPLVPLALSLALAALLVGLPRETLLGSSSRSLGSGRSATVPEG